MFLATKLASEASFLAKIASAAVTFATTAGGSKTARANSLLATAGGVHAVFGLGVNGTIWAANVAQSMFVNVTGAVNIKTATVTTATKAIDTADDIFVIGTAANLTVTDIVIV
jgi:hypothetical protein